MRKYGQNKSSVRKHKKINKMNIHELNAFKSNLEADKQVTSKVYQEVINRMG